MNDDTRPSPSTFPRPLERDPFERTLIRAGREDSLAPERKRWLATATAAGLIAQPKDAYARFILATAGDRTSAIEPS